MISLESQLPAFPNKLPRPQDAVEDFAEILLAIRDAPSNSQKSPEEKLIDQIERDERISPELAVSALSKKNTILVPATDALRTPDRKFQNYQSLQHVGFSSEDEYDEDEESYQEEDDDEDDEDVGAEFDSDDEEWVEPYLERSMGSAERRSKSHSDHSEKSDSSTGSPSSRPKRKKAPSGSACEKHKRWKKRCPDDCPMRKAKFRNVGRKTGEKRGRKKMNSSFIKEEERSPKLKKEEGTDESLAGDEGNDKPSGLTHRDLTASKFNDTICKSCNRKDVGLSLRCTCTKRSFKFEPESAPTSPLDKPQKDRGVHTRRNLGKRPMAPLESPTMQKTKRLKYLPRSCERHKLLHAKCPADCPDRLTRDEQEKKVTEKTTDKIHWKKKIIQQTSPNTSTQSF